MFKNKTSIPCKPLAEGMKERNGKDGMGVLKTYEAEQRETRAHRAGGTTAERGSWFQRRPWKRKWQCLAAGQWEAAPGHAAFSALPALSASEQLTILCFYGISAVPPDSPGSRHNIHFYLEYKNENSFNAFCSIFLCT